MEGEPQVSTAAFVISFQNGCYRNCPAKTYSVEEEMTCVQCDENCVSCGVDECYWCETDLFLSGKTAQVGQDITLTVLEKTCM